MLETIKAYGLQRLAEAGETEQVRQAHAAFYLELAENAEPHLRTSEQITWLDRLDAEHDNIHAALRAAIAAADATTAVRFVAALGWYWNLRAKRTEGFELTIEALNLPGDVPDETRALAYVSGGLCAAYWPLDESMTEHWFRTAMDLVDRVDQHRHPMLRLARPMNAMFRTWSSGESSWTVPNDLIADPDPWVRGMARFIRAYSAFYSGTELDRGERDLDQALAAFHETGDRAAIGMALGAVAEVESWHGDFAAAIAHTEQALELVTELASAEDVVQHRLFLARQRWLLGDHTGAHDQLAEAARAADRAGLREYQLSAAITAADLDRFDGAVESARGHLDRTAQLAAALRPDSEHHGLLATANGCVAAMEGDFEAAAHHHRNAIEIAVTSGDAMIIARALTGVADLALARGKPELSAQLLGAGEAIRGQPDRSLHDADRVTAAARAALGDTLFAEAYARGRRVTTKDAARNLAAVMLGA
jgi:tetratricopeptide (TPR) repeat protein